jgi:hypothetical protein
MRSAVVAFSETIAQRANSKRLDCGPGVRSKSVFHPWPSFFIPNWLKRELTGHAHPD